MKVIKEYQVTILIVFIIASILYGIHMFRYEFIIMDDNVVVRYDRITNTQCISIKSYFDNPRKFDHINVNGDILKYCDKKSKD
jgi:hypothetical protein